MEFLAICGVAVLLGLRGFRAGLRAYSWIAGAAVVATVAFYHFG